MKCQEDILVRAGTASFRNKEKEGFGRLQRIPKKEVIILGFEIKDLQVQDKNLEQINEMLLDALSLIILLENDMETQKADGIHTRILKMVHDTLKSIQRNLVEYIRQGEK